MKTKTKKVIFISIILLGLVCFTGKKAQAESWTQIGGDGLNSSWTGTYERILSSSALGSNVYVGLGSSSDDADVWSWDGATWTQIGGDSLNSGWASGFENVYSMTASGSNVYAGLGTTTGDAEVWQWNGSAWTKIGGDGINSGWGSTYERVISLTTFGSDIIAGLGTNGGDAEVWSWNGSIWTKIGGDGVNSGWSATYEYVSSMTASGSNLYVGLGADAGDAEIWSWDGGTWTKIGGDGVGSSWTGHDQVYSMTLLGSILYIGLAQNTGQADVWSWDGATWTKIGGDGINSSWAASTYEYVSSMAAEGSNVYVSLGVQTGEAEVWSWDGATWTQIGGDGINSSWADATYESAYALLISNSNLYVGLGNHTGDAEVWSTAISSEDTQTDTIDITWAIGETISLSCSAGAVSVGAITGDGQGTIDSDTCNVRTNDTDGYTLAIKGTTKSTLDDGDTPNHTVAAYTEGTPGTPEAWSIATTESAWGVHLGSGSTTTTPLTWGADSYAGNWIGVLTSDKTIASRSDETLHAGDDEIIYFGAEVGTSKIQPSGSYTGQVTLTATTNP